VLRMGAVSGRKFPVLSAADWMCSKQAICVLAFDKPYSYTYSYSIWHGKAVQPTREPRLVG
jgi:hypothetical protein